MADVPLTAKTWTLLTAADVTDAFTFQNKTAVDVPPKSGWEREKPPVLFRLFG